MKKISAALAFDVFVSYSSRDKAIARQIAQRLKDEGLRVWFDEWEILPGDPIGIKIERALGKARTLVVLLSSSALGSEWVTLERHTMLFRDPTNADRRFIPVRLDNEELPDVLKQFAYVDLRERSEEEFVRLSTACRPPRKRERSAKREPEKIFSGHRGTVYRLAITRDGTRVVSGSHDATVRLWDVESNKCLREFVGHFDSVSGVAITGDGSTIVSASHDKSLRVWDAHDGRCLSILKGHRGFVYGVAVTPDGKFAVSCSEDWDIRLWDLSSQGCLAVLSGHNGPVGTVALTPDGKTAISCSKDRTVRVWDIPTRACSAVLAGHSDEIWGVAISDDGSVAISGSNDRTVRVWDLVSNSCKAMLEGHTGYVHGCALSADGRRAASSSWADNVRIWNLDTGGCEQVVEQGGKNFSIAMTPDGTRIACGSKDRTIRVWEVKIELPEDPTDLQETRYSNAKVLVVGESGVGKSGLAIRLSEGRFAATISTDAAWATQMTLPGVDKGPIEREIWLWDFAGQADYRLIHQLFMDETALAVLVFNPQSEDPFESLSQWDRDITRAARGQLSKILVAGRCDRGGLMVSHASIERFRLSHQYSAFVETSALMGTGCEELRLLIINNVPWHRIPWTTSPRLFRLLKNEILRLRDEGKVLLRMSELKQQLAMRLPTESFSSETLEAAVGLLAGPGVLWKLEFGDFVLLHPERMNAYASAVIRSVRAHADEIGCITEERVLSGELDYQQMVRLPPVEEEIVLRAMYHTFVQHGLCLREHTESGPLLVFPSYFKRERPVLEDHPTIFVSYQFSGPLDEIYATLVVRLHYTPVFERDQLWRHAADFRTQAGRRLGLKMKKNADGSGEITVYIDPEIPDDTKVTFIRYIHEHLKTHDPGAVRIRHYSCPHCQTPIEGRKAVQERLARGLTDILCINCEKRVAIMDLIEMKFASTDFRERVRELEEQSRHNINAESLQLILMGHAISVAGESGQLFRNVVDRKSGIDSEIEFKDGAGLASGAKVLLQFSTSSAYEVQQQKHRPDIFAIRNPEQAKLWLLRAQPVMLVARGEDGNIEWMNVTECLTQKLKKNDRLAESFSFKGESLTAFNLQRMRDRVLLARQRSGGSKKIAKTSAATSSSES